MPEGSDNMQSITPAETLVHEIRSFRDAQERIAVKIGEMSVTLAVVQERQASMQRTLDDKIGLISSSVDAIDAKVDAETNRLGAEFSTGLAATNASLHQTDNMTKKLMYGLVGAFLISGVFAAYLQWSATQIIGGLTKSIEELSVRIERLETKVKP